MKFYLLLVVLLTFYWQINSASISEDSLPSKSKILVVYPLPGRSHYILGNAIAKGLVNAGHDVTMLSPFSEKNPPKGPGVWREIILDGITMESNVTAHLFQNVDSSKLFSIPFLNYMGNLITEKTLTHPKFQKLINSKTERFDAVVIEQFNNDALKVLASIFNAPQIVVSSLNANGWVNGLVANPAPYSYVPEILLSYTSKMTFFERVGNTLFALLMELNRQLVFFPNQNALLQKYVPNAPHLKDFLYNASLILLNSHISITQPLPLVPSLINIGGYHIFPPKELPADLKSFLDDAKEGVVYFSMGSNLKSNTMPEKNRDILLKVFSKLKQKVLWKWEDENLPGKPNNVKISSWLPQQDILAHPNVKLFITHGGLLSTTEAIYHGVPVLLFPIFGDQQLNAAQAENNGYGITISFTEMTEEILTEKINELLTNPTYRNNAKTRSKIFHDRELKPMDRAVYWIEYVIRHKGATHLRVEGLNLPWYQYLSLDVFAFLFSVIIGFNLLIVFLLRKCMCKSKKSDKKQTKSKVKKN